MVMAQWSGVERKQTKKKQQEAADVTSALRIQDHQLKQD